MTCWQNWTQAEVDAALQMGYADGLNAVTQTQNAADTLQFFALKKKRDQRVQGVTFEKFVGMKAEGHCADFSALEDSKLQYLFLQ